MSRPENVAVREHHLVQGMSVADLLDFCNQRELEPEKVKVTGSHITWDRPETDEERDRRLAAWKRSDERKEEYERKEWQRLREKYGDTRPPEATKGWHE